MSTGSFESFLTTSPAMDLDFWHPDEVGGPPDASRDTWRALSRRPEIRGYYRVIHPKSVSGLITGLFTCFFRVIFILVTRVIYPVYWVNYPSVVARSWEQRFLPKGIAARGDTRREGTNTRGPVASSLP